MATYNRNQIENYYEIDWGQFFSQKSLAVLIELTCQSYKLNQIPTITIIKEKELVKTNNLGHI